MVGFGGSKWHRTSQSRHRCRPGWLRFYAELNTDVLWVQSLGSTYSIPGTRNNQFKMDLWWFPTISYVKDVKVWFIIQLKQPLINGCLRFQVYIPYYIPLMLFSIWCSEGVDLKKIRFSTPGWNDLMMNILVTLRTTGRSNGRGWTCMTQSLGPQSSS